jgi:heme-degrading monooxygenase HmoA
MIAVLFEVEPIGLEAQRDYLREAAILRPHLETMEGFISVERFESLAHPGKFLSLSYWKDEASIHAWREQERHREAQAKGRSKLFARYVIRTALIIRELAFER